MSRRQQLEAARLRHQLELQSQQIEHVFSHHHLPAKVEGGHVDRQTIHFDLQEQVVNGLERLWGLKQDLTAALGVSSVHLHRENGAWQLQVERPKKPPVALLELLNELDEVPTTTAVLGLAENQQPILLNFLDPNTRHVLLAGVEQAGKTMLLRAMALSLALLNRQSKLQLMVIDVEQRPSRQKKRVSELEPLNYLPHLLQDVVQNSRAASESLTFLCNEMVHRQDQLVTRPTIVVLIDNVVSLLRSGQQDMQSMLLRLLQHGAEVGIHLVLGTRRPEARELDAFRKVDLPIRIVGRLHDAQEAVAAANMPRSRAEYLLGKGDFLAIADGVPCHFQAAFTSDYDVHLSLRQLHAQRPTLLAQTFTMRPSLPPASTFFEEADAQAFQRDDSGSVTLPPPRHETPPTYQPILLANQSPLLHEAQAYYETHDETEIDSVEEVAPLNTTSYVPRQKPVLIEIEEIEPLQDSVDLAQRANGQHSYLVARAEREVHPLSDSQANYDEVVAVDEDIAETVEENPLKLPFFEEDERIEYVEDHQFVEIDGPVQTTPLSTLDESAELNVEDAEVEMIFEDEQTEVFEAEDTLPFSAEAFVPPVSETAVSATNKPKKLAGNHAPRRKPIPYLDDLDGLAVEPNVNGESEPEQEDVLPFVDLPFNEDLDTQAPQQDLDLSFLDEMKPIKPKKRPTRRPVVARRRPLIQPKRSK